MYMYGQLYINVHNTFLVFSCSSWSSSFFLLLPGNSQLAPPEFASPAAPLCSWQIPSSPPWAPNSFSKTSRLEIEHLLYSMKHCLCVYIHVYRKNLQTSTNSLEKLLNSWSSSPSSRRDERNSWRDDGGRRNVGRWRVGSQWDALLYPGGDALHTLVCHLSWKFMGRNCRFSPENSEILWEIPGFLRWHNHFQLELILERLLVTNFTLSIHQLPTSRQLQIPALLWPWHLVVSPVATRSNLSMMFQPSIALTFDPTLPSQPEILLTCSLEDTWSFDMED